MDFAFITVVAFAASALSFLSGFGLATIMLPCFMIFFDPGIAMQLTAFLHLFNNLIKLFLTYKHIDRAIALKFGIPSLAGAFLGAWMFVRVNSFGVLWNISVPVSGDLGRLTLEGSWAKIILGVLLIGFLFVDSGVMGRIFFAGSKNMRLVIGGIASGFFGGVSGHQGAVRSFVLTTANLGKQSFIATGVVIACCVDLVRLAVYGHSIEGAVVFTEFWALGFPFAAVVAGNYFARRLADKISYDSIKKIVQVMMIIIAAAMLIGAI